MPSFYAMILAGAASFMVGRLLKDFSGAISMIVASLVWVFVFYFMKKFLKDLKP